jgi:hypothetical protein
MIDAAYYNETAKWRGIAVHAATAYLDQGVLDRTSLTDERVRLRVEQYEQFKRDVKPEILAIEMDVEHPIYGYCGALDRLVIINGNKGVLDIKGPYKAPWHPIQLAGYADCFWENGQRVPLHRWILHLDDHRYDLVPCEDRNDRAVFLATITINTWRNTWQKKELQSE